MSKVNKKNQIRRNLILRALLDNGQMSLTELKQKTGITLPVVSNIVESLKKKNLLVSVKGNGQTQAGRPPSVVKLNGQGGFIIGLDLGRIYTNFILLDLEMNIVADVTKEFSFLGNDPHILKKLKDEISSMLSSAKVKWDSVLGMGFSIPGIVDGPSGISETYLAFGSTPLRETLKEFFKKPVQIEHDVKALALGELWFGKARNVKNALCLKVDWGLGLGIIIDGKIYYGNQSHAGEFGHIQLIPDGKLCYCGKIGCLETVASGRAVNTIVQERLVNNSSTLLLKQVHDNLSKIDWKMLIETANNGDQFSIEIMEETAKHLGHGIGILINLFSPDKIIVGGGFSRALPHILIEPLKISAKKNSLIQLNRNIEFVSSDLDPKAGALGVAMLAAKDLFEVDHLNPSLYV